MPRRPRFILGCELLEGRLVPTAVTLIDKSQPFTAAVVGTPEGENAAPAPATTGAGDGTVYMVTVAPSPTCGCMVCRGLIQATRSEAATAAVTAPNPTATVTATPSPTLVGESGVTTPTAVPDVDRSGVTDLVAGTANTKQSGSVVAYFSPGCLLTPSQVAFWAEQPATRTTTLQAPSELAPVMSVSIVSGDGSFPTSIKLTTPPVEGPDFFPIGL